MEVTRLDHPDDVRTYLDWLTDTLSTGQPIAIDTETRSIEKLWDPIPPYDRGHGRLYQIGTGTEAWAIDFQDWHHLVRHSQELVAGATCDVLFANAPYDQSVFRKEGAPIVPWHRVQDVVVAHRLSRFADFQHGLKPAAAAELGDWALEGEQELKDYFEEHSCSWDTIPTDAEPYWTYGGMDTCLPVMLWPELQPLPGWYDIEMEYLRLCWDMTWRGVPIDEGAVLLADSFWNSRLEELTTALAAMGFENPASSKKVTKAFAKLGHDPEEFSARTGDPTYNKWVLATLQEQGGHIAKAAELLIQWRSTFAWRNNYGRKLLDFADANGRIHPDILTMQARTGRSSIRRPPLQTIPKEAITRNMFLPGKAQKLVAIDYESQEIRIAAGLSEDPAMLAFFSEGGGDYHQYVADLAKIPRDAAKTVNYARAYGAGAATMARTAGCDVEDMEGYLAQIDRAFPRVMQWKDAVTSEAEERAAVDGYPWVELPYGRKAALFKGHEFTQAANTQIQGHGADVLKLAAVRGAALGLDDYYVLPQHDEMLMSFPEELAAEGGQIMADVMVDQLLPVTLTTEASEPLDRWGQKYGEF